MGTARFRGATLVGLLVLAVAAAVTAGAVTASVVHLRRMAATPLALGDTVVRYGPQSFTTASGVETQFVEAFTVPVAELRQPVVRVAKTSGTFVKLEVELNGATVVRTGDFGSDTVVVRPIILQPTDTLKVRVAGSAGATASVSVLDVNDGTFLVFGPEVFVRQPGKPQVERRVFTIPEGATSPAYLCVMNGRPDGTDRVSSARVFLNGVEIIQEADLNQQVAGFVIPVTLQPVDTLTVQLGSVPNSRLSLCLRAMDGTAPVLTVTAPTQDRSTTDSTVLVTGTVTDETPVEVSVNGQLATLSSTPTPGRFLYSSTVPLSEGSNSILIHAVNAAGLATDSSRNVIRDSQGPDLTVTAPVDGVITNADSVLVTGIAVDANPVTVNVNGVAFTVGQNGAFSGMVPLQDGRNMIVVTAADNVNNSTSEVRTVILDKLAPTLVIESPTAGLITRFDSVTVSGTVVDSTAVTVTVNGTSASVLNGAFSARVPLAGEGSLTLSAQATDAAGNSSTASTAVFRDIVAPVVVWAAPTDGSITNSATAIVTGSVADVTAVNGLVNSDLLTVNAGAFAGTTTLAEGPNTLALVLQDAAGNETYLLRTVTLDTQAPVLMVASPVEGLVTGQASITVSGTATDASTVTVTVNGAPVVLGAGGAFSTSLSLSAGANVITVVATDAATNASTVTRNVTKQDLGLPPNPAVVAPQLDRTITTNIATATAFLYGADSIQKSVVAGAIVPQRAAVIRGRVLDRNLQPLAGVLVRVQDHPELGSTLSRTDGWYDLAVNGGGELTTSYGKPGYLPAQRQTEVPWQAYTHVADVVLLQPDVSGTVVNLAGATTTQVALSSTMTDVDGSRQAILMFDTGTVATMRLPDGSTQPLSTLTVRTTEYTVGASGPSAMPAPLPATTFYTWAANVGADEAVAAGATEVTFSKPVALYVDNFLNIPAGTPVPLGYLNPGTTAWTGEENARVIKVLDTTGGIAQVDANGDGVADTDAALNALGIDLQERAQMAQTMSAGALFWRALLARMGPFDLNFTTTMPFGVDPQATVAPGCSGKRRDLIRCDVQVARQGIGAAGTPFALTYSSASNVGRTDRALTIALTGATLPQELQSVHLEISVAGQLHQLSFPAAPNLQHVFTWDGKDAYGRVVQGSMPVTVRIGYAFPTRYQLPAALLEAWAIPCDQPATIGDRSVCYLPGANPPGPDRSINVRWQTVQTSIGNFDAKALGLGGMQLSAQHVYDPVAQVVYRGDGRAVQAQSLTPVIRTAAGTGSNTASGIGGLATKAGLPWVDAVAAGPDGSIYVSHSGSLGGDFPGYSRKVYRISPSGVITHFAGNGNSTFAHSSGQVAPGENGPAVNAPISQPTQLAVGPDGSVYITDASAFSGRILKVEPSGIIRRIAGGPNPIAFANGVKATRVNTQSFTGLTVGPDGTVYFTTNSVNLGHRVLKVTPDTLLYSIAGTGVSGFAGTNGMATRAQLQIPWGVAVGDDGSVYIAERQGERVSRVAPDGFLTPFAGGQGNGFTLQGVLATQSPTNNPSTVHVLRDGSVLYSDVGEVRVVSGGIVNTLSGARFPRPTTDGMPARAAGFTDIRATAIHPNGDILIADPPSHRIRRISLPLKGFGANELVVTSDDGSEIFVFSGDGRHIRTHDARTRNVLLTFGYDAQKRLITVTDAFGQVTTIERDAAGNPTALVASTGQRTSITLGANGYVASVTGPDGFPVSMTIGATGLLTQVRDPNGIGTAYTYNADGLVTAVQADGTGGVSSTVTGSGTAKTITFNSQYEWGSVFAEILPTTEQRITARDASGRPVIVTENTDGSTTVTQADGMSATSTLSGHPLFGLENPLRTVTERTPLTLTRVTRQGASVVLDPATDSVVTLTDTSVINGRASVSTYDYATRTRTNTSAAGRRSEMRYNLQGLVTRDSVAGVRATTFGYDAAGRLTTQTQGNRSTTMTYDASGRLSTVTDATGLLRRMHYDAGDRPTVLINPRGDTTRMAYDSGGRVTAVTPPGRPAHTFTYTPTGQTATYSPPSVGDGAPPLRMFYDQDDRLTRVLRPAGDSLVFTYDSTGRTTSVRTPEGLASYRYGSTSGLLDSVSMPTRGKVAFQYEGSLLKQRQWTGPVSGSVNTSYDTDYRPATETVNFGHSVSFVYDADSRLIGAGALTLARDPFNGRVTGTALGAVGTAAAYDPYGAPSAVSTSYQGNPVYGINLLRDSLGRIVTKTETVAGVVTAYGYTYNAAGHLAEVRENGQLVTLYTYDANGNRTGVVTPNGTVSATFDAQDRMLAQGTTQFTYTAGGELREQIEGTDTTRYTYAPRGELLSVRLPNGTLIEYTHDPQGRRTGKKVNGVLQRAWLYGDGLGPVAELDGNNQVVSRFVYAGRPNVPEYMVKAGVTYRLVHDQLGSVRLVLNTSTGAIAQRLDYDAYGRVLTNTAADFQPFGFAGGLYDTQTGLVRYGARDFSLGQARWTSKDPIRFEGGSSNLYEYAKNSPVNEVDPSGLFTAGGFIGTSVAVTMAGTLIGNMATGQATLKNVARNGLIVLGASTTAYYAGYALALRWGWASQAGAATTVIIGRQEAIANHAVRATDVVLRMPEWLFSLGYKVSSKGGNLINDMWVRHWLRQGARFESVSPLNPNSMWDEGRGNWTNFGQEVLELLLANAHKTGQFTFPP